MDFGVEVDSCIKVVVKSGGLYRVILHNDDTTTMDFVVECLVKVFGKSVLDAANLTLRVHKAGHGVVDSYPKKLAEAKKHEALQMAAQAGFNDFSVTVEEA